MYRQISLSAGMVLDQGWRTQAYLAHTRLSENMAVTVTGWAGEFDSIKLLSSTSVHATPFCAIYA